MKTIIVTLNSKYVHSSLAPWLLKAYCGSECGDIQVLESTINDNMEAVLTDLYSRKADVIAFSCFIWNIAQSLRLAEDIKKLSPSSAVVLGGPEVSFDAEELARKHPFVDFIIQGEGEATFKRLLQALKGISVNRLAGGACSSSENALEPWGDSTQEFERIGRLVYRKNGSIVSNAEDRLICDLNSIPSPYTHEMLQSIGNRIVYFESSRGCPFSCSYCLSSTFEGVRFYSMERVKADLKKLAELGVKQVKFVDRTFNCHKARAKEILRFILDLPGSTNFHFEVAADLFDEELLELISKMPSGKIQFEIGMQTVNEAALCAVNRRTDTGLVLRNIAKLRQYGNVHLHLDLIAGLPYESLQSFRHSFDEAYRIAPHQLQLGFLKMLKGAGIRKQAEEHGYIFRSYPPYELLASRYMSYEDLQELKGMEELLDRYYNSGKFSYTLGYLMRKHFSSPFTFYQKILTFCRGCGYLRQPVSGRELYTLLDAFCRSELTAEEGRRINEILKLDFLASDNSGNLPPGIVREMQAGFSERCFEFLKKEENIKAYLPSLMGMPAKQIYKQVRFEAFSYDVTDILEGKYSPVQVVLLFDYHVRDKVTGLYRWMRVVL